MRRTIIVIAFCGTLLALFLTGCTSNPTNPAGSTLASSDQAAIENLVTTDALFTNDATMMDDGSSSLQKTDAAIDVKTWGRKIDWSMVSHTVTYEQQDSVTVVATITNTWGGNIWIRERRTSPASDTTIYKPFSESSERKIRFTKIANTIHPGLNWRMREVSAMEGGTTTSQGISIQKIDFYVGEDTIEVTSPLDFYLQEGVHGRHCLEELPPSLVTGFRVQVTVKSNDPDSDLVVARRPFVENNAWSYRSPMALVSSASNGDGTYNRVYETSWRGAWSGRHQVMVGAVPRNAIYDDSTSFSSQIWGIPYIVD